MGIFKNNNMKVSLKFCMKFSYKTKWPILSKICFVVDVHENMILNTKQIISVVGSLDSRKTKQAILAVLCTLEAQTYVADTCTFCIAV
jgi:hypothetical protein